MCVLCSLLSSDHIGLSLFITLYIARTGYLAPAPSPDPHMIEAHAGHTAAGDVAHHHRTIRRCPSIRRAQLPSTHEAVFASRTMTDECRLVRMRMRALNTFRRHNNCARASNTQGPYRRQPRPYRVPPFESHLTDPLYRPPPWAAARGTMGCCLWWMTGPSSLLASLATTTCMCTTLHGGVSHSPQPTACLQPYSVRIDIMHDTPVGSATMHTVCDDDGKVRPRGRTCSEPCVKDPPAVGSTRGRTRDRHAPRGDKATRHFRGHAAVDAAFRSQEQVVQAESHPRLACPSAMYSRRVALRMAHRRR